MNADIHISAAIEPFSIKQQQTPNHFRKREQTMQTDFLIKDQALIIGRKPRLVDITYSADNAIPLTADRIEQTYADGGPILPFLERIYAVGANPIEAIQALGQRIGWGDITNFDKQPVESIPEFDGWYFTFQADGISAKACGHYVPGGAVLNWWK